jgi:hypothetical protein
MKETHRLGSTASAVEAATWHTFARAEVFADGHGAIEVVRDGATLARFDFGPENVRTVEHVDTARSAALMPGEPCPAPCRACDGDT